MRVKIDHEERTTGWVRKKTLYVVKFDVQFSDEERHVIENTEGFTKMIVVELPNWEQPNTEELADIYNVTVYTLLRSPDERRFQTIGDARVFAKQLQEQLPLLKEEIQAHAEVPEEEKSTSFEL